MQQLFAATNSKFDQLIDDRALTLGVDLIIATEGHELPKPVQEAVDPWLLRWLNWTFHDIAVTRICYGYFSKDGSLRMKG